MPKKTYKARFATDLNILSFKSSQEREAFASLGEIAKYIPENIMVRGNDDLLYVAFNGTVANRFNLNGDGISIATAVDILPKFSHKQVNLQHVRSDIVGHTLNAGFATFEDSIPLSVEEALQLSDPVNLSVAAAIYKIVNPKLIQLLRDASNENESLYHAISASWEVAFSDYHIALGSKDLKEAEIITDPKQIEELEKYLPGYKEYDWQEAATGKMKDGTPVYRLIVGNDILPTGFGLTPSPAADVKGIYVVQDEIEIEENDDSDAEKIVEKTSSQKKNEKKCSTKTQVTVNQFETNALNTMDEEKIK